MVSLIIGVGGPKRETFKSASPDDESQGLECAYEGQSIQILRNPKPEKPKPPFKPESLEPKSSSGRLKLKLPN